MSEKKTSKKRVKKPTAAQRTVPMFDLDAVAPVDREVVAQIAHEKFVNRRRAAAKAKAKKTKR